MRQMSLTDRNFAHLSVNLSRTLIAVLRLVSFERNCGATS